MFGPTLRVRYISLSTPAARGCWVWPMLYGAKIIATVFARAAFFVYMFGGVQEKIADVLRLDGKHMTENQLLKLGRRHLLHAEDPRRPT